MKSIRILVIASLVLALSVCALAAPAAVQTPAQFFGFKIGADGELARYPKVVEYLQYLAQNTDRVKFQELGKTTLGNPYVLAIISSSANLAKLDRLVEINRRLADPRGLPEAEAMKLAREGRPFYFLYATIHSTELGNGQAIIELAHDLATSNEPRFTEVLDNSVLLLVPSQNPDGQILVIDHWYKTKGTQYNRNYPDLYHVYTGHDDNRDWFMFTQIETRLNVEKVQNVYRPQVTHDMHQMGSTGARIFVPPFSDPYDPNIHPILAQAQANLGLAMASALVSESKGGVAFEDRYDMWTPARQYMVYHGQPRILTEIASVNLADPFYNPAGKDKPLGPQESRWNFPLPYSRGEWHLRDIVNYSYTVALAGLTHVSKYRTTWLENFYKVQRDWVNRKEAPYAFVLPAEQPDPYETYELLQIMDIGDVEIHQARAPFQAGGKNYAAGSWVIKIAQPFGAFAKTMLEKQVYPDLRYFPGGPPIPPYDVTGQTLGMLMGVQVDQVESPFEADLELLSAIKPVTAAPVPKAKVAYLIGPESNAGFIAVARLQKAGLPVLRAAAAFTAAGKSYAPGTWIIPAGGGSALVMEAVSRETGLTVGGTDEAVNVDGFQIKSPTRIGLWRAANNMPGGWLKWLFEQYGFNHQTVSSLDFNGDLSAKYDVIVLPTETSKRSIVQGLDSKRNDESWRWAFGVGEKGWQQLQQWVHDGGTIVVIGSAVETVKELCDLPIGAVLPEVRRRPREEASSQGGQVPASEVRQRLRNAFQSPANLIKTLEEDVVEPSSLFYCPGSLLNNEFDNTHPVGYGMPSSWPVFFAFDQAYRVRPGFGSTVQVVARYPQSGPMLASGWLLGDDLLRDQANVMQIQYGRGTVVALASEVDFRTQPRGTFKLFFNAMFQGPAKKLTPIKW